MGEEMEDLKTARGGEVGRVGVGAEGFVGVGLERNERARKKDQTRRRLESRKLETDVQGLPSPYQP